MTTQPKNLEEVLKEFDEFMWKKYGQIKSGNIDIKEFIKEALIKTHQQAHKQGYEEGLLDKAAYHSGLIEGRKQGRASLIKEVEELDEDICKASIYSPTINTSEVHQRLKQLIKILKRN